MHELAWRIHPLLLSAKTLAVTFVLLLFLGLGAAYFLAFYRGKFKAVLEAAVGIFATLRLGAKRRDRQGAKFTDRF